MLTLAGGLVLGVIVLVVGYWAISEFDEWVLSPFLRRFFPNKAPQYTREEKR